MIWNNFLLALSKYADFKTRSRRAEFWGFTLISLLISAAASIWDNAIFDSEVFGSLVDIVFFIPSIAVGARRLHDTGRSGWWQLLALTGIGLIPLFYWYAKDGEVHNNKWGASPKYGTSDIEREIPIEEDQIV